MPSYACVMCGNKVVESRQHLFFECPFARLYWKYLCPNWDDIGAAHLPIDEVITSLRAEIAQPFSLEIVTLVAWALWTTRNDFIFKGKDPSVYRCRKKFKDEMALLLHKAKRKAYRGMESWVLRFT